MEQGHGIGKTTFALQIAERVASRGKSVVFVSLEMSSTQLIHKIISKKAGVSSRKLRNGEVDSTEIDNIAKATQEILNLKFNILTKCYTIQRIEIEARKLKNKGELDLLVIDYLQLVKNEGRFSNREQQVSDISRTLKLLSLELDVPIIALCQLNRNAADKNPTMADIRESGAIEQDADNIIFLYPENKTENDNIVNIDLQKQRAGNIGIVKVKFKKITSEFINLS